MTVAHKNVLDELYEANAERMYDTGIELKTRYETRIEIINEEHKNDLHKLLNEKLDTIAIKDSELAVLKDTIGNNLVFSYCGG